MDAETTALVWQYEQGTLRGQQVIDLFRTLWFTKQLWNIVPQEPHTWHYLEQAAQFYEKGYFNHGGGA